MSKTQENARKPAAEVNQKLAKLARRLGDAMASASNHRRGLFEDMQSIKQLADELNEDEKEALMLVLIRTFEEFQLTAELLGEAASSVCGAPKESEIAAAMKTAKGVH